MVFQVALLLGHLKLRQGGQQIVLIEVEQHLAVVQVFDRAGSLGFSGGYRGCGSDEQQRGNKTAAEILFFCPELGGGGYHSVIENSGCWVTMSSAIFSSINLGESALSKVSVAARR